MEPYFKTNTTWVDLQQVHWKLTADVTGHSLFLRCEVKSGAYSHCGALLHGT